MICSTTHAHIKETQNNLKSNMVILKDTYYEMPTLLVDMVELACGLVNNTRGV